MIGVVTLGVPLVVGLFLASILGWFSFNAGRRRRSIWFVALVVLGSISICALLFSAGGPPWTVDETMRSSKYFEFFLLMVGCLMDVFSAILVVVPIIIPLAIRFGVDPIHLGIIFLTNLEIGYSTPPVGMNLFIASLRFDKPVMKLYWASLPWIALMLICLALITYLPVISLWLPALLQSVGK